MRGADSRQRKPEWKRLLLKMEDESRRRGEKKERRSPVRGEKNDGCPAATAAVCKNVSPYRQPTGAEAIVTNAFEYRLSLESIVCFPSSSLSASVSFASPLFLDSLSLSSD